MTPTLIVLGGLSCSVTGTTADKSKSVTVTAHLFGFGRPVRVTPPREGTFIDQKLQSLAA